jgi:hypothetical protein
MAKKKAFKRKSTTVTVQLTGDYEGLEVTLKALTIGDFREILPVLTKAEEVEDSNDLTLIQTLVDDMVGILVKRIVSWNMEDDNGPVPVTEIADEEIPLIMGIFQGWTQAMTGVDKELGKDSVSGETSPMPSIVMETL